jgi:hypothetical protein
VVVFEPHRSKVAAAKLHAKGGDGARRGVHLLALLPRARLVSVVSRVSSVSIGNRVYVVLVLTLREVHSVRPTHVLAYLPQRAVGLGRAGRTAAQASAAAPRTGKLGPAALPAQVGHVVM